MVSNFGNVGILKSRWTRVFSFIKWSNPHLKVWDTQAGEKSGQTIKIKFALFPEDLNLVSTKNYSTRFL